MEPIYDSSSIYFEWCPKEPKEHVVVCIPHRYGTIQRLLPSRYSAMLDSYGTIQRTMPSRYSTTPSSYGTVQRTMPSRYLTTPDRYGTIRRSMPSRYSTMSVYNQYPNWMKMAEENGLGAFHFSPSVAPQIPHKVHEQLSNDFLPAAKNVGQTGILLLRAYHGLQESLSAYCDAIHKLIQSADTADAKSQSEARELSKHFKGFVQGVKAHQKIVEEFEVLALKVNDYSQKDKEKLKTEYHDFKKDEKKILKQKHSGSEAEKSIFYQKSAADWARQQELRYKFFNDKVQAWTKCYSDMGRHLLGDGLEYVPVAVPQTVLVTPPVVAEEHSDWHEKLHEDAAVEIEEEKDHKEEVQLPHPVVQVVTKQRTITASTDSSVATTLDELPSSRVTIENSGVTLVSTHKRESVDEIDSPIPRAPRVQPIYNQYSTVERTPSIRSAAIPPVVAPTPAPRRDDYDHRHSYVADVPPRDVVSTRNGRILPGAVPVFGMLNNAAPNVRYTPRNDVSDYQVVTRDRIPVGRVVDTVPLTEEQMNIKKFHVESNYVAQASPAHQPSKHKRNDSDPMLVQSFFNPSQYGSILIVNDDFNASSKEQMTVNRGDKVILLKCGSRGWVFVRDSVSNRTGWLPEPYVNP